MWFGKLAYIYRKETQVSFRFLTMLRSRVIDYIYIYTIHTFLSYKKPFLSLQESLNTITKILMTLNPLDLGPLSQQSTSPDHGEDTPKPSY